MANARATQNGANEEFTYATTPATTRLDFEDVRLPDHLADVIDPAVLAEHRKRIYARLSDRTSEALRRERYLRTIVDRHLWEELRSV